MNRYEGMFVFPDALKDDTLDEAVKQVKGEIEKLGGEIESTTRIGRRAFARPQKKEKAGIYIVMTFRLKAEHIATLHARMKLKEEVFRAQIVRADEAEEPAAATAGKEARDGVTK